MYKILAGAGKLPNRRDSLFLSVGISFMWPWDQTCFYNSQFHKQCFPLLKAILEFQTFFINRIWSGAVRHFLHHKEELMRQKWKIEWKVKSIWVCSALYEKSEEVRLKILILKAFVQVEWKIESIGVRLAEAGSELFTFNK